MYVERYRTVSNMPITWFRILYTIWLNNIILSVLICELD